MYKCNICGETTTTMLRVDGEQLCPKCGKAKKKKPGPAKTSDPFIKLLRKFYTNKGRIEYEHYAQSSKGRAFTDGAVLLSEMEQVPKKHKMIHLQSLVPTDGIEWRGKIENLLPKEEPLTAFEVPKDFYTYAKAFKKLKQETVYTVFDEDGIHLFQGSTKTPNMEMHYRETSISAPSMMYMVNLRYMVELKPHFVEVYSNGNMYMLKICSSHNKVVDAVPTIILAGMMSAPWESFLKKEKEETKRANTTQ